MTPRQSQSDFARCLGKLLVYIDAMGYECTLGDTYPGKYKHSPGGQHPKGLAIDLNLFKNGVWLKTTEAHARFGAYWKALGGEWGGDFPGDGNHYQWKEQ